jgi:hypothetical protein
MNWKDKINDVLDKLAGWLGLTSPPVPVPVRKDPRDRRRR